MLDFGLFLFISKTLSFPFAQVKEVELAVEEQELQKHAVVKRKFEEISKLEARIKELEEQLVEKETVSEDIEKYRQKLNGESCRLNWIQTENK